ncbi:MAG: hypothetical protein JXR83_07485, partial [Deltaproteobacteria bacterium]|nr:hypothetical protein [Deltaproteobacteria bacterium]
MTRMLGLSVLAGIIALAACPPPDDKKDAGTPDSAVVCDRPYGVSTWSESCYYEDDCVCGLNCVRPEFSEWGVCMQLCDDSAQCPAQTPLCSLGSAVPLLSGAGFPTFTDTTCVMALPQYGDCLSALGACDEGLVCDASVGDDEDGPSGEGNGIKDYYHCQEVCEVGGTNTCSNGEQDCVASNAGAVGWDGVPINAQFQLSDPGNPDSKVECDVEACLSGGTCTCNAQAYYRCLEFASGTSSQGYCAKPTGICGSLAEVMPIDELATARYIDNKYICMSDQGVGCDITSGGMLNGPEVTCLTAIFASDPSMGICMAQCGWWKSDGTFLSTACPGDMECLTDPAFMYTVVVSGNNYVRCTDDSSCAAYESAECVEFTVGHYCARPLGYCGHPLPPEDGGVVDSGSDAGMPDTAAPDAAVPDTA